MDLLTRSFALLTGAWFTAVLEKEGVSTNYSEQLFQSLIAYTGSSESNCFTSQLSPDLCSHVQQEYLLFQNQYGCVSLLVIIDLLPGHFRVSLLLGLLKRILQLPLVTPDPVVPLTSSPHCQRVSTSDPVQEIQTSNNVGNSLLNCELGYCMPD